MLSVFDVAKYILNKLEPMSAMKLQKIVYYCQAWSLVWDGAPLYNEKIEAWANGPVVPSLYKLHRGQFLVNAKDVGSAGDARRVRGETQKTIDSVIRFYGDKSPHYLSELTHMEAPWKEARKGMPLGTRGKSTISHSSMAEYYSGLQ